MLFKTCSVFLCSFSIYCGFHLKIVFITSQVGRGGRGVQGVFTSVLSYQAILCQYWQKYYCFCVFHLKLCNKCFSCSSIIGPMLPRPDQLAWARGNTAQICLGYSVKRVLYTLVGMGWMNSHFFLNIESNCVCIVLLNKVKLCDDYITICSQISSPVFFLMIIIS